MSKNKSAETKAIATDSELFRQDVPKILLLVCLYAFQGLCFGLFLNSIPLLFKKYLTYQEIGLVTMCTMPFSFKVLWAPIIEIYHIPGYPKRKSWVVPMQLIISIVLFYLSYTIDDMLKKKEIYLLSSLMMFVIFIITCQDIAVDSWAVEMLHPKNSSYGSSAQSIGHKCGSLISGTFFIAFNSVEFCNKYIFSTPQEEPFVTIPVFVFYWACVQSIVTIYIALFISETKYVEEGDDEEELKIMPSQIVAILKDIFMNKNLLYYFLFVLLTTPSFNFDQKVSQLYITDELKFSRQYVSSIKLFSAPINMACSLLSGYFSKDKPFRFFFNLSFISLCIACYSILVMIRTFPTDPKEQQSTMNLMHYSMTVVSVELCDVFWFTTINALIYKITDKRIAGIHITLLASCSNWVQFLHKFYLFRLVDAFGIFYPQIVLASFGLIVMIIMRDKFLALDDIPISEWMVSDDVIKITTSKIEDKSSKDKIDSENQSGRKKNKKQN